MCKCSYFLTETKLLTLFNIFIGNIEEKLEIHENAYDKLNETIIAFKRCGFDKGKKKRLKIMHLKFYAF